jgi:transposase
MRYELSDFEWTAIKPMLPNKPRGVPRVATRYDKLAAIYLASSNSHQSAFGCALMSPQPRTSGHPDAGIWRNAGQYLASRGAEIRRRCACPIAVPVI